MKSDNRRFSPTDVRLVFLFLTLTIFLNHTIIMAQTGLKNNALIIARIWHGRTPSSKADGYYQYLNENGVKKIKSIEGNLGIQVFRRVEKDVTHFTVISYWKSLESIRKFAGSDIEKTNHLPRDKEFLLELEPNVVHHEVILDERKN